ncbi:unnamed protein product [Polarella glacialis]|uniref:SET domain-containing protein n=1 Tax=Polarella glacialis TaxID=89957 RepID=A0A813L698_POLGL|nr:unnamed protein product [Polarella glacialis]
MECILKKEYDPAREVLRSSIARGVNTRVAEQYGKVLEEFLQRRDEIENPVILARYNACEVRVSSDKTGRGLFVPAYQPWGAQLWKERPLAFIQSPCSRKCAQVCRACLSPVGSLASQLRHLDLGPVPPGAEDLLLDQFEDRYWERKLREVVNGEIVQCAESACSEVFCSKECRDWALGGESSHSVLCAGRLPAASFEALQELEQFADDVDTEHLLLLAHVVAQMLLRRKAGDAIEEVKRRFLQFISSPWEEMAEGTPEDTPELRREHLEKATVLLQRIFAGEELASELLEPTVLSSLMGSFELVNMCIALPHPLNRHGDKLCELLGGDVLAKIAKNQEQVEDDDSDVEGDADDEGESQAEALEAARTGSLFGNVIGTALCEALAFTNHSCLPNCRIDFATAGQAEAPGPGLWVYSVTRRPLVPGDEVLMSYVPSVVGRPLEVRQEKMRKFGFPCSCRTCETDKALAAEGDVVF